VWWKKSKTSVALVWRKQNKGESRLNELIGQLVSLARQ
jgi:hypothetical protein